MASAGRLEAYTQDLYAAAICLHTRMHKCACIDVDVYVCTYIPTHPHTNLPANLPIYMLMTAQSTCTRHQAANIYDEQVQPAEATRHGCVCATIQASNHAGQYACKNPKQLKG